MTDINKIIKKGVTTLLIIMVVIEVVGYMIFQLLFKDYYFDLFPMVIVFYSILGSISISIIANSILKAKSIIGVNIYLTTQVIKIAILIFGALLYALFIKVNIVSFFIVYAIVFLVYTIFETRFSIKTNNIQNESSKNQQQIL